MAVPYVPIVSILLRRTLGDQKPDREGDKPFQCYISKGELLVEIPPKEQIPREDGTPAHNYSMYHDPYVTMYDSGINLSPLHGAELDYLEGIENPRVRAQEYLKPDKLEWIMELIVGDIVYCKMEKRDGAPLMILGKVRYYGAMPKHHGVMFGLEIVDKEHRGKGTTDGSPHFQCGYKNGVYVSMDKIIKKTNVSSDDNEEELEEPNNVVQENPRSGPAQNNIKKEGGLIGMAKAFLARTNQAPFAMPDSTSRIDSQFSEGDRVVVQTVREKAITGIVRWVGPVKMSKETGGIIIPVVGIETDKKIDCDKEFPDLHVIVTGSHSHHLFPVTSNHSQVFLPEQLVLHIDEYTKQKQEDNTTEAKEAKKWGMSVEEYRAQMEMLSKGNEEIHKDHDNRPILINNQQNEENLATGGKPSVPIGKDKMQLQKEGYKIIQREQKRKQSLEDYMYEIELQDQPVSLPYHPVHQNVPHLGSPSLQKIPDSSQTSPHSQHQDGSLDQISLGLAIGSMVQTTSRGGDPIRGVIKWIGIVPNYQGHVAGVDLDIPMEGCTDGSWNGKQYFKCPPGRALFCPLRSLEQDTRYMEPHQVPAARRQELKNPTEDKVIKIQQQDVSSSMSQENKKLQLLLQQKESENAKFQEQIHLLKTEKNEVARQLADLKITNTRIEAEKDQLTNEIAVLREQVRKKEQSNITDIKYWEVSHTEVKSTGVKLGDGGWGTVEVGFFQGQKVALKMLHSDIVSPFYNELVRREIAMMVKVRHPNLLLCIAAVLDHPSGSPIIITEVMDTSLRKMYKTGKLDYKMKLSILRDVASALNYLHCHQDEIIHRDVSSANVLLEVKHENEWKAKLSDFGSANLSRLSKTTAPGAEVYGAPEVPREQTTKMDVYSYGILLCELLTNQFPLREAFPSMLQILANNWRLMHQLVLICTKDSPKDRPNMSYILQILYEKYPNILN